MTDRNILILMASIYIAPHVSAPVGIIIGFCCICLSGLHYLRN